MEQQEQKVLEVSPEAFRSWIDNPITKKIIEEIVNERERAKDFLVSGQTLAPDADVNTERLIGRVEGLISLFNLFQEVKEEAKEAPEYDH